MPVFFVIFRYVPIPSPGEKVARLSAAMKSGPEEELGKQSALWYMLGPAEVSHLSRHAPVYFVHPFRPHSSSAPFGGTFPPGEGFSCILH